MAAFRDLLSFSNTIGHLFPIKEGSSRGEVAPLQFRKMVCRASKCTLRERSLCELKTEKPPNCKTREGECHGILGPEKEKKVQNAVQFGKGCPGLCLSWASPTQAFSGDLGSVQLRPFLFLLFLCVCFCYLCVCVSTYHSRSCSRW